MKFIDLFAGIGGFRRGMEMAGHECVGFCEFDKYATASYTAMHLCSDEQLAYIASLPKNKRVKEILNEEYRNGEWYCDDVRNITGDTIPKADCWCFGAPCQDFSVAGKRAGLEGDRSSLVREVFRILKEIGEDDRPEWLVYENVKGMLGSNNGFDFLAILSEMDDLGYDCEWQMYNSKYFVPQNRERVYLVGHLRKRGRCEVFSVGGSDETDSVSINILGHHKSYRRNTQIFSPDGITETLSTCQGGGREHYTVLPIKCIDRQMNRVVIPVLTPERANKRQNGRRFKDDGEPAFTLTGIDRHGVAIGVNMPISMSGSTAAEGDDFAHCLNANDQRKVFGANQTRTMTGLLVEGSEENGDGIYVNLSNDVTVYAIWYPKYECYIAIRKLTPRECFRLQGWADDYFDKADLVNSDSQLYKQAGNGVTVDVVFDLACRLHNNITKESVDE